MWYLNCSIWCQQQHSHFYKEDIDQMVKIKTYIGIFFQGGLYSFSQTMSITQQKCWEMLFININVIISYMISTDRVYMQLMFFILNLDKNKQSTSKLQEYNYFWSAAAVACYPQKGVNSIPIVAQIYSICQSHDLQYINFAVRLQKERYYVANYRF